MSTSIVSIGFLKDLTELVAAHGAFALVVIFIFYLWNRAVKNLRDAKTPAERKHFQRIHTATVVFTFFLGITSTVVWVYANFIYEKQTIVRGFVSDLIRRDNLPEKPGDAPRLIQEIIPPPRSSDLDFYSEEEFEITDIGLIKGHYTQKWVLFCDPDLDHIIFTFRQQLAAKVKIKAETSQARISRTNQPDLERKYFRKRFRLDFAEIEHPLTKPIELIYKPDSLSIDRPGTIFRRDTEGKRFIRIPWESAPPTTQMDKTGIFEWISKFPPLSVIAAYANGIGVGFHFEDDGSYDPQIGRLLRRWLGSPDLNNQLLVKRILAENGRRSFKFIIDSLNEPDNAKYDRGLLIYNLAEAIREIERTGKTVPPEVYKAFALSFYDINDYESSLDFFNKIDNEYIDRENLYFKRAFAYGKTEQYDKSIENYNKALDRQDNDYYKATIYINLGVLYRYLGQKEKAIEYYQKAIKLDPEYARAYSNLGVVYDDLGQKEKAIEYYQKAIKLDPEDAFAYNNLGVVYRGLGPILSGIVFAFRGLERFFLRVEGCSLLRASFLGVFPEELWSKGGFFREVWSEKAEWGLGRASLCGFMERQEGSSRFFSPCYVLPRRNTAWRS